MFCNGVCHKGSRKCGLLLEITMQNDMTGEVQNEKVCAFTAMLHSMHRLEQGQVRLQAATESSRNEACNYSKKVADTVATGFLGMIHTLNDSEKSDKMVKVLKLAISNT
jgi:hypothetical protein